MPALRVVGAETAEQDASSRVLDERRDGALAESAGGVDEGLHHNLVRVVSNEIAHELAVDFEVVERQELEVVEGAVPGAEVVEREGAAERRELFGEGASSRDLSNRRRFGDLDDQPAGSGRAASSLRTSARSSGSPSDEPDRLTSRWRSWPAR